MWAMLYTTASRSIAQLACSWTTGLWKVHVQRIMSRSGKRHKNVDFPLVFLERMRPAIYNWGSPWFWKEGNNSGINFVLASWWLGLAPISSPLSSALLTMIYSQPDADLDKWCLIGLLGLLTYYLLWEDRGSGKIEMNPAISGYQI